MSRNVIVVLLILSITSSTMVVGCDGGVIALQLGVVLAQFAGSIILDKMIDGFWGRTEAAVVEGPAVLLAIRSWHL